MRAIDRSDYLAHYGIKGMKWGVRRFQNKDGSYTSAGLKRRGGSGAGGSRRSASGRARSGSGTNAEARKARMKKALMIGAGLAGTAALAYGIKSGKLKGAASALKNSKLGQSVTGAAGSAAKSIKKGMDRTNPNSAYSKARSKISSARINAGMGVAGVRNRITGAAGSAAKSIKKGMDRTNPNSAYSKARSKISSAGINAGMGVAGVRNRITGAAGSAAKSIKKGMDRTNPNSAYSKARSKISSARINAGMNVAGAASNLRKSVSSSKLRNSKVGRAAVNTTLKGLGNAQRIPGNVAGAARAARRSIASRGITRDKLRNTLTGNNSSRLNTIKSVGRSVAKNKVARAAGIGAASLGAGYAGMAGLSAAQKKVWAKQGYNQYSSKSNKGTRKRKRR